MRAPPHAYGRRARAAIGAPLPLFLEDIFQEATQMLTAARPIVVVWFRGMSQPGCHAHADLPCRMARSHLQGCGMR